MIQSLFRFAKFSFEAGDYALAADCLHFYRMLDNTGNTFATLWGKLAADILSDNWDAATDGIRYLLTAIDNKVNLFCPSCPEVAKIMYCIDA